MAMRLKFLKLAFTICVAGTTALAAGTVASTFDTDAEGWGTLNDARDFTWTDAFGNPAGAIRATDVGNGQFWFFSASDPFLGDKESFFGGELQWDIYGIVGNQSLTNRADVMLTGGDLSIGIAAGVAPSLGGWSSWEVMLTPSTGWRIVNSLSAGTLTSTPVSEEQMRVVLADLTGMYIRGEYTNGADSAAIDNVRLVPPPCGDVTGDGAVNLSDLNVVLANFGAMTSEGDTNSDGVVNLTDLNIVLAQFGGNC